MEEATSIGFLLGLIQVQILVLDLVPQGYIVPALAGHLDLIVQERPRRSCAAYVLDARAYDLGLLAVRTRGLSSRGLAPG